MREITFNDQGLREGTPGEFAAFPGTIEGYTHQAGTRNVLRVKRFQPGGAQGDPAAGIFVLELTVETEMMQP